MRGSRLEPSDGKIEACLQTAMTSVHRATTMMGVPAARGNLEGKRAPAVRPSALSIALVGNVDRLATMPSARRRGVLVGDLVVVRAVRRGASPVARGATMLSAKRR